MSNMSYCRFQNTAEDLHDCLANMDEAESELEQEARLRLIQMCVKIALDYGDEINQSVAPSGHGR